MSKRKGQLARRLARQRVEWDEAVEDPRDARGRRHAHHGLLNLLVLGFASGLCTLRRIEELSWDLCRMARRVFHLARRVSDTTLYLLLASQSVEGLRETLVRQVKRLWERKRVSNDLFPLGVVSLDGKSVWTSHWKTVKGAKQQVLENGETLSSLAMLDAVLVSSSVRPCLDVQLIPEKSGEAPASRDMVRRLVKSFGACFEVVMGDAGLTCRESAELIRQVGKHFVLALKGNQPTLFEAAEEAFAESASGPRLAALPECRNGGTVTRTLHTLTVGDVKDFAAFGTQEVWQVLQETEDSAGRLTTEVRYFLSSLPPRRLSPRQKLALVRLHWGVECHHWTLDTQLRADDHQPCQLSAHALEVTCWLRALAYNLVSARRGALRDGAVRPAWARVLQQVRDMLVHALDEESLTPLA